MRCAIHLSLFLLIGIVQGGCDSGPTVELSGLVKDIGTNEGLEFVQVCLNGADEETCSTTRGDGTYILTKVPADSDVSLTVSLAEYHGGTIPVEVGLVAQEVPVVSMAQTVLMELQMGLCGLEPLEGSGQAVFSISNGINGDGINVPGITVKLVPNSGAGPFYAGENGLPNLDLVETSANGGGVLANIPAGKYSLNHSSLPQGCTPMLGWKSVTEPSFEVLTNRVTYLRMECLDSSSE